MARHIPKIDRRPHIFLSHNSKDKQIVKQFADDLMLCEVDVWLDEWEIEAGDSILEAISNGIQTSKFVALVITSAFNKSKWASEEIQAAFSRQIENNEKVILPLLFENVEIHALLRGKLYLSFIDNYYKSLTKLAGIVHGINPRDLSKAIDEKNPTSISETLDTLYYCGFNPHMLIPKNVFEELSNNSMVEVIGNRLRFPDLYSLIIDPSLSELSKSYISRVWQGDRSDTQ